MIVIFLSWNPKQKYKRVFDIYIYIYIYIYLYNDCKWKGAPLKKSKQK